MSRGVSCNTRNLIFVATGFFLIGLAHLAIFPPFEGLDETAHYSSIRQILDAGQLPVSLETSFISSEVIEYRTHGPMPYDGTVSPVDPDVPVPHISYAEFYYNPQLMEAYSWYRTSSPRLPYEAKTAEFNWEADQQPVLYYLSMVPVMKITDTLPFVTQFFILRVVSFTMVFAGLLIGLVAMMRAEVLPRRYVALGFLIYPLAAPTFFVEFGRLGNDSLCLLLFGIIWALILMKPNNLNEKLLRAVGLGVCFGLGLLTKAFFMPFLAGLSAWWLLKIWRGRRDREAAKLDLIRLIFVPVIALVLSSRIFSIPQRHSMLDFHMLASLDWPTFIGLAHQRLSIAEQFLNVVNMTLGALWAGSASEVYMSSPFLAFTLFAFFVFAVGEYLYAIRRESLISPGWLPLWLMAPLIMAILAWHILMVTVFGGDNGTGGWYLHVTAPACILAYGFALRQMEAHVVTRGVMKCFVMLGIIFLAVIFWTQISMYAGCAGKDPDGYFLFPDRSYCLGQLTTVIGNLAVIGWPDAAMLGFGAGFICLIAGAFGLINKSRDVTENAPAK